MVGDGKTFSFSTSEIPERERVPVWREFIARELLRFEAEPLAATPFSFRLTAQTLAGLRIISVSTSPVRTERTRALLADGDDSLCVLQMSSAAGFFAGLGCEVPVGPRDAILMPRSDVATFAFPSESKVLAMHVPRAALAPMLRDGDGVPVRLIPARSEALQLLGHFVSGMENGPALPAGVAGPCSKLCV